MNIESAPSVTPVQSEERLPWHKPEVQRLKVSLDTAAGPASAGDGGTGSEFVSDRVVKKDITRITDALNGILSLNGVTYRYDNSRHPELDLGAGPQIGFIAQELEQVYPQVVKTRDDGLKAVNYGHLVPVLVEAIKQQQSMIVELQGQVQELQKAK